jgi:hypothetical protein
MDFVTNPYADSLFSEIQVAVSFTLILALICIANYNPGKSVALVGYLLFYLIANGELLCPIYQLVQLINWPIIFPQYVNIYQLINWAATGQWQLINGN